MGFTLLSGTASRTASSRATRSATSGFSAQYQAQAQQGARRRPAAPQSSASGKIRSLPAHQVAHAANRDVVMIDLISREPLVKGARAKFAEVRLDRQALYSSVSSTFFTNSMLWSLENIQYCLEELSSVPRMSLIISSLSRSCLWLICSTTSLI